MSEFERRKNLSFKEAEGKIKLPAQYKWGEISPNLASRLWSKLHDHVEWHIELENGRYHLRYSSYYMLRREWFDRRSNPVDLFKYIATNRDELHKPYRETFFSGDYGEVFDFVQFIMRDKDCPQGLINGFRETINAPGHPYSVVGPPLTIIPRVSEEERESLQNSMDAIQESEFAGARKHLELAMTALSEGDASGTIRESIHAIESTVRQMSGNDAATLGSALRSLKENGLRLHPALKKAVSNLY